ncbi:hypothetical protein Pelo_9230 [Pelomyxa schiedti]|nr:hypothetical protein Pelo_9230 [Pelomyxa schiedti]
MLLSWLLSLAVLVAVTVGQDYSGCIDGSGATVNPLSDVCFRTDALPNSYDLTFCHEFTGTACCTEVVDDGMGNTIPDRLQPVWGTDCCYENIRLLACAWNCASCSTVADVWETDPATSISNLTLYVSPALAQAVYESCSEICISTSYNIPAKTVAEYYGNAVDFIESMRTNRYPGYVPTPMSPQVWYEVGTSETAAMFDFPAYAACGADTVGCLETTCANSAVPGPRNLTFCTWYADDACCNTIQEENLQSNMDMKVSYLFGSDCCFGNIQKLFCGWLCDPNTVDFLHYDENPDGYYNLTVYVDTVTADGIYNSCKDRCLPFAGNPLVSEMYPTSESFIQLFNSDNDPAYDIDSTGFRVFYYYGDSPYTDQSFVSTSDAACGTDLTSCEVIQSPSMSSTVPFRFFFITELQFGAMSDAEEGTGRQDEAIGRLRERFMRYWLAVVGRDVSLQLYDKTKASGVLVAIDSSQDQLRRL